VPSDVWHERSANYASFSTPSVGESDRAAAALVWKLTVVAAVCNKQVFSERGTALGVGQLKLSARAALQTNGALPENVNYAVKSSFLLSFLESVPEVAAKLKEPNMKDRKFEDVVQSAAPAAVLVLVY